MGNQYYLYAGQGKKQYFSLPDGWRVSHFVEPGAETAVPSVQQMTAEALSKPKGAAPLQELVSRAQRIAIIVDDLTRPTPAAEILEVLLSQLSESGFSREKITIVMAIGTHDAMTQQALETKLGKEVVSTYRVVQHNAWQSDLVSVRIPGEEKVVKINPEVAKADLRLGLSSILPHPMAGYGGGPKIVMPGVCNYEYIRDHHSKHVIHPKAAWAVTQGNPFHEYCMKTAKAIGLDLSINCVYDQKGEVNRIIAGSLETAFAEAVKVCLEKLGHRFEEKVDVTITSTYPHTHGHQFFKGFSAPDIVTQKTGAVLIFAPVVAPIVSEFLNSFNVVKEKSNDNSAAYVKDMLSQGKPFLPDKPMDFNMAMSNVFLRPQIRAILVSPLISKEEARTMRLEYASSMEEGLGRLRKDYPEARTAIFPAGGLVIPMTAWER